MTLFLKNGGDSMNNIDVMNLEDEIQQFINETNKYDLNILIHEIQQGHYPNVLSKAKDFREKYMDDNELIHTLWKVSAISHAEIQEYRQAKEIISDLYYEKTDYTVDELVILGQLAFMCDYKLARRIMSAVIKKSETEQEMDSEVLSGVYLILGETEENLEKPKRALKYYKNGFDSLDDQDEKGNYIKVFLAFKIGMLHTTLNEQESALEYLKRSLEYTDDSVPQLKINSLVGIGQIYASLEKGDEGYPYLREALDMLPQSTLKNSPVHMDALLEMGYYHYSESHYEKAIIMYEQAIQMYTASKNTTPRKLGMMYMQYAYCLANQQNPQHKLASAYFEKAIVQLEKEDDIELLHSALNDVIAFFDKIGNKSKQQYYENRMFELAEKANA